MTDCPPKLRGDLSKWLVELDTGVYVGQFSGRVRDAVWERVCKNLKTGRAAMVYTTNNEQRMEFRVHNTAWQPVDFDGIKLMRRPLPQSAAEEPLKPGFSKAAHYQMATRAQSARNKAKESESYTVIDLETTGLHAETDQIIEYGALRVKGGEATERFSALVRCETKLPSKITALTGITDAMLQAQGQPPAQALDAFLRLIGRDKLVGHNIAFDLEFLRAACRKYDCQMAANRSADLLDLARRRVDGVADYKLPTLAVHFGLPAQPAHRALPDCELVQAIYEKLKQK